MNYPLLKPGARGAAVGTLQVWLKAVGLYADCNVDQIYGPQTTSAVKTWQRQVDRLMVDGITGPNTWGALQQALLTYPAEPTLAPLTPVRTVDDATWQGFQDLVQLLVTTPCRYVAGRGAYDPERGVWLVRNRSGNYPRGAPLGAHGFVCSTFTNFLCAFLLRRDELYTGTGGMPALALLMEKSSDLHQVPGLPGAEYRGYGEHSTRLFKTIRDVRASTIYEQRTSLPTFLICQQASRRNGGWIYHHTCAFIVDHRNSTLHRIAADGYRGSRGFSKTPMVYKDVTEDVCTQWDSKYRFRCYSLDITADIAEKPMSMVQLE